MTSPKEKDEIVFVRLKNTENMRFIHTLMLEKKRSMRDVVERMVDHCRRSKSFSMSVHKTTAEKLAESQRKREKALRIKTGEEVADEVLPPTQDAPEETELERYARQQVESASE